MYHQLVDELVVECVNLSAGCTFTCQRQLLATHLKDTCQYTQVSCMEAECGQVVMRKDAGNHSHRCVHRLQECDGCGAKFKVIDMEVCLIRVNSLKIFIVFSRTTMQYAQRRRLAAQLVVLCFPDPP